MFYEFAHRHTPCTVDGVTDKVILSRDTKSSSVIGKEYMFIGRFSPISPVLRGSMIVASDSFLIQTLRLTPEKDKYCSMVKTNAVIQTQRYSQTYDANDNPIGGTFNPVQSNVKAYAQYVTAQLRQEDIGLLPTTAYVLYLQTTVNVKRPQDTALIRPDRIVLNGRSYQVDVLDDVKIPGLLYVQLSEDTR